MVQPSLEVWRMSEKARMDQNTHTQTKPPSSPNARTTCLALPVMSIMLSGAVAWHDPSLNKKVTVVMGKIPDMEASIKQLSVLEIFRWSKDQQFLLVNAMFFLSLFLKLLKYVYWFTCFCNLLSPLTHEVKEKCDAQSISRVNYFRWHIRKYSRVAEFHFTNAVFSPLTERAIFSCRFVFWIIAL